MPCPTTKDTVTRRLDLPFRGFGVKREVKERREKVLEGRGDAALLCTLLELRRVVLFCQRVALNAT